MTQRRRKKKPTREIRDALHRIIQWDLDGYEPFPLAPRQTRSKREKVALSKEEVAA